MFIIFFLLCLCNSTPLRGESSDHPSFNLFSEDNSTEDNSTFEYIIYEIDWITVSSWASNNSTWNESTLIELAGFNQSHVQLANTVKDAFAASSNASSNTTLLDKVLDLTADLAVKANITEICTIELSGLGKSVGIFVENVTAFDPSGAMMNDQASIKNMLTSDLAALVNTLNSLQDASNDTDRQAAFMQLYNLNFTVIMDYLFNLTDLDSSDSFNLSSNGLFIGIEENNVPVIGGIIRIGWKSTTTNDTTDAFQAFMTDVKAASVDPNALVNNTETTPKAGMLGIIIGIPIAAALIVLGVICCLCVCAGKICQSVV